MHRKLDMMYYNNQTINDIENVSRPYLTSGIIYIYIYIYIHIYIPLYQNFQYLKILQSPDIYYLFRKSISVTTSISDVHNPPKTVYRSMNNRSAVNKQVETCNKLRKMKTCLMNHQLGTSSPFCAFQLYHLQHLIHYYIIVLLTLYLALVQRFQLKATSILFFSRLYF